MGNAKPNPKQVLFIAGMKGPELDPAEVAERVSRYLKYEARLDSLVRHKIFTQSPIKPGPKLVRFIQTYKPNAPSKYEESEISTLLRDASDLADELNEAVDVLGEIENEAVRQAPIAARDSMAFKTTRELLDHLSSQRTRIEKTMTGIKVPRPGAKADATLKDLYAAASACIAVATMVWVLARKTRKDVVGKRSP